MLTGRAKLAAPDDTLVLEDASARMALRGGGCLAGPLVTGVVAAVRGAAAPGGDFVVKACAQAAHGAICGPAPNPMRVPLHDAVIRACVVFLKCWYGPSHRTSGKPAVQSAVHVDQRHELLH